MYGACVRVVTATEGSSSQTPEKRLSSDLRGHSLSSPLLHLTRLA
ncbi:hypothetical protein PC116_g474 [Phytophthora cactorum]|uniref:Uncharacterized protein n=1 Tax=Phytophthora cactorum TaxID=29920 RepID=A0A8T1LVP6_9STRA|nr:hypothetical protein PC114_g2725 [Phytophthora cactorum]KAG2951871.1 hypothetical protein PC117_g3291 [Phytophthora cactorum]KAG3020477.1 hypothetical protein PC119_g9945 [Phytophthora cactorum]KAG3020712.1 hypothetical protein PC120_g9117 [Phytophthora cactorum]KAG3178431.1 hypothetical protein C6341_g7956 [Phytophthora cactorum]